MRKDQAAARATEAHERARQAAARLEQIAGGLRASDARPGDQAGVRAEVARTYALRGFTHAREAHLRAARMHEQAAEWAARRGDPGAAEQHRTAADEARAAAAAEPDGAP